ncbi:cellulase family glycosylhydrolase [Leifsonia sp. F6_8S_P_1B]|uniref:Cellulase family glycosylhydrolase n=1 Tax=Leifsonia williamsii TaxID=3035919 RepID=A0ABT8KE78_9MICO|nr:cellulase family glycosylhydrolase [Leifsonia williamsii]MDN4615761.1 cellulase family glycosylhydrolase [Leifsonia williamsii]
MSRDPRDRPSPVLAVDGEPAIWLGANFWSRTGGPLMWTRYDPAVVREELRVLAEHGLNMTRSFFYWPDFQPTPDTLDEQCVANFADFLDAHVEAGMTTVPTYLVGHMSGENWDPVWREGRDLYRDVWFVGRQAWYVRELTRRFAEHPAVAGWLLTNEVPIYGGEAPRPIVAAWASLLVDAVRAGGGTQPVAVGDGAWGIETTGHDNGFSVGDLAEFTDFVGPHVYRMETDQVRQHLKAAYIAELCATGPLTGGRGLPVVMEEFGLTSDFVSDEGAASYYRQLLYNTLLAGATGWIAWNNTDYDDLVAQRPYSHHPFELHFGITDRTGAPKPPLRELARFAEDIAALDLPTARRAPVDAAIVVPSHLAADYPFTNEEERAHIVATGEQAYVAAHEAHLPVAVVREREDGGLPAGYGLYLLPSVKQLCGPSWYQLEELARGGATVYASYSHGTSGVQRGPWWANTEALFGVRPASAYGLAEPVGDDVVTLRFVEDFGTLHAGETLTVRAAGNENARTYLPVTVTSGRVVAEDAAGRPAIVVNELGAGRAVLSTYPLEAFAAGLPRVNPEETWRLYDALAAVAEAERDVLLDDPLVFADALLTGDGRRVVVFVSQHPDAVTVRPEVAGGELQSLDGAAAPEVQLEPYGVALRVLALE